MADFNQLIFSHGGAGDQGQKKWREDDGLTLHENSPEAGNGKTHGA
jgi:hypothetical protein